MIEKDYAIPLEMLWEIWNGRLRKLNSDIKELRITSISVSVVLWFLIFISSSTFSIVSIVSLTLGSAAMIWGMSYLMAIRPYSKAYFRETPVMGHDYKIDPESFAMLLKDIENSCLYLSRRLYLIRLLVSMSVLLTTVSILALVMLVLIRL